MVIKFDDRIVFPMARPITFSFMDEGLVQLEEAGKSHGKEMWKGNLHTSGQINGTNCFVRHYINHAVILRCDDSY